MVYALKMRLISLLFVEKVLMFDNYYLQKISAQIPNTYRRTGKESDFRTKNLIATCQRKKIKTRVADRRSLES